MRFFTSRSLALATLVPALLLFVVVPGCAKQSEGERCGDSVGPGNNDDCADGLTCTFFGADGDNRCCYSNGNINDSRCEPKSSTSGGGASSGGGSGTATAGVSAGGSGGSVAGGSSEPEAGTGGEAN